MGDFSFDLGVGVGVGQERFLSCGPAQKKLSLQAGNVTSQPLGWPQIQGKERSKLTQLSGSHSGG